MNDAAKDVTTYSNTARTNQSSTRYYLDQRACSNVAGRTSRTSVREFGQTPFSTPHCMLTTTAWYSIALAFQADKNINPVLGYSWLQRYSTIVVRTNANWRHTLQHSSCKQHLRNYCAGPTLVEGKIECSASSTSGCQGWPRRSRLILLPSHIIERSKEAFDKQFSARIP